MKRNETNLEPVSSIDIHWYNNRINIHIKQALQLQLQQHQQTIQQQAHQHQQ